MKENMRVGEGKAVLYKKKCLFHTFLRVIYLKKSLTKISQIILIIIFIFLVDASWAALLNRVNTDILCLDYLYIKGIF